MKTRVWKDVEGYEGRYQVSDDGYVRSLPDIMSNGKMRKGVVLTPSTTSKGYLRVVLDGQTFVVHRLVAKAFLPAREGCNQVNHVNGVKTDNTVCNLEWVSNSENQAHRYRVLGHKGTLAGKTGWRCHNSRPVVGVPLHGEDRTPVVFAGASEAARVLGISQAGISRCVRGELRQTGGYYWRPATPQEVEGAAAAG